LKNILFVIDSLGIGGAEKALLTQAKEFHKLGYEIYCISIYNHIQFDVPSFVHLHILDWKNYKIIKYKRNAQRLYVLIKSLNKDFSGIFVHLDKAIALMRKYQHPRIYYVIHNNASQQELGSRTGFSKIKKRRAIQKFYSNLNLITVSKGVEEDLLHSFHVKCRSIQTIYNTMDFDAIIRLANEKLFIEYTDYIVHVGRLVKAKRHDILLQAFKKADLNTKLLLVGDGQERDNIVKMIEVLGLQDKVELLGFATNPYALMKNAKLLILTSEYEGFGIVLAEALSLGTPVMSTDCPSGPNEILTGAYKKYLVKVNDVEDISNKLKFLYKHPYKIDKTILLKFDKDNVTEHYIRLLA